MDNKLEKRLANITDLITQVNHKIGDVQAAQDDQLRRDMQGHHNGEGYKTPFIQQSEFAWYNQMSMFEMHANIFRSMGSSGMINARDYSYAQPGNPATRRFSMGYGALGMHNHPNYHNMPGSAEWSLIVNGYAFQTRHNDYRMAYPLNTGKGTSAYRHVEPPKKEYGSLSKDSDGNIIGGAGLEGMQKVFEDHPEDCIYHMTYLNVWFEEFHQDRVDENASFRHQISGDNTREIFERSMRFIFSGQKARLENIPFEPLVLKTVDDNGVPRFTQLKYRIYSVPVAHMGTGDKDYTLPDGTVTTLKGLPFDEDKAIKGLIDSSNKFIMLSDEISKNGMPRPRSSFKRSSQARFRLADGILEELMNKCPSIDGYGANITEQYFDDDSVYFDKNMAYFSHFYGMGSSDASNRSKASRSFNDQNLFVAMSNNPKVVGAFDASGVNKGGYIFGVPMELVLLTPRQSWNPYGIKEITYSQRNIEYNDKSYGVKDKPFSGSHINGLNYKLPYATYLETSNDGTDAADTSALTNGKYFINDSSGIPRRCAPSGVNIITPDGYRQRFPIYSSFHDFTRGMTEAEKIKKVLVKFAKGELTPEELEDLL